MGEKEDVKAIKYAISWRQQFRRQKGRKNRPLSLREFRSLRVIRLNYAGCSDKFFSDFLHRHGIRGVQL